MHVALIALLTALTPQEPWLTAQLAGNAGVIISDGRTSLLVDVPHEPGAFGYQSYDEEEIDPAGRTVAVITHNHRDHFDAERFLQHADWLLVGPPSVAAAVPETRVIEGDSVAIGEFHVIAVSTPHTPDHRSYRIRWRDVVIYVTGDTEDVSGLTAQRKIDLLLVTPWLSCRLVSGGRELPADRTVVYHLRADGSDRICGDSEVHPPGTVLRIRTRDD